MQVKIGSSPPPPPPLSDLQMVSPRPPPQLRSDVTMLEYVRMYTKLLVSKELTFPSVLTKQCGVIFKLNPGEISVN